MLVALGLGTLRLHAIPHVAGYGGLPALRELIRATEFGVSDITITGEELGLRIDGLIEHGGGFGELSGREEFFGARLEVSATLPEGPGFQPAQPGI